jgi:glutamate synthase domain-containing protein 3
VSAEVDCRGKTPREINREIRKRITVGETEIRILYPEAQHNLGVAVLRSVRLIFEGSVGYYCAGMSDGVRAEIRGSAGWGLAECLMGGSVVVDGSAGNGAAASIRGGEVVVRGNAGARAGVSLKGGTVVIGGDCGYMTGFMAQKGMIVVCGDAGEALADSMYEGVVFVGGSIASLGNDAVVEAPTDQEQSWLRDLLSGHGLDSARDWKKVVSGRKLWNFDKSEALWREAL